MVLSSQLPREGNSRRHMVSRKRRAGSRWPWVGGAIALVVLVLFFWMRDGSPDPSMGDEGETAAVAPVQESPQASSPAPAPASRQRQMAAAPVPVSPPAPEPTPVRQPRTPVVPIETFQPTSPEAQSEPQPRQPIASPAPRIVDTPRTSDAVQPMFREGMEAIELGQLVQGRQVLNRLLLDYRDQLSERDEQHVRDIMASINQTLVFSREIKPGDDLVDTYTVQAGDHLGRIAPSYKIPYQIIEHINSVDSRRIQVGQKLKMVKGPFHAVVVKSAFRMDVFLEGSDGRPVYITSFPVGLGETGSTPNGLFRVGVKLENPGWTNPRTNQTYAPDDPDNPIGDFWIALEGIEEATENLRSYGIHGTIEPHTIGTEASMGCVRMRDKDIAMTFKLLQSGVSTVRIVP